MSWTKILTVLFGIGMVGSTVSLPVRTDASDLKQDLTLSQNFNYEFNNENYGDRSTDNLRNVIGLTGLAIGTGVIGYHLSRAYKPSLANLPAVNAGHSELLGRVSPKLRRELLRLVHNQATASRLLSGTSMSHPGRNPNWVAEKVIYDLKRGR